MVDHDETAGGKRLRRPAVSIPPDDEVTRRWWEAQVRPSDSVRVLVHRYVADHGCTDAVATALSQGGPSTAAPEARLPRQPAHLAAPPRPSGAPATASRAQAVTDVPATSQEAVQSSVEDSRTPSGRQLDMGDIFAH